MNFVPVKKRIVQPDDFDSKTKNDCLISFFFKNGSNSYRRISWLQKGTGRVEFLRGWETDIHFGWSSFHFDVSVHLEYLTEIENTYRRQWRWYIQLSTISSHSRFTHRFFLMDIMCFMEAFNYIFPDDPTPSSDMPAENVCKVLRYLDESHKIFVYTSNQMHLCSYIPKAPLFHCNRLRGNIVHQYWHKSIVS